MTSPATPTGPSGRSGFDVGGELPCGRDVDDLLEQAAAGHAARLTEHQQTCAHCQATLREFTELWAPVHAMAAARVEAPESLYTAVMARVSKLVADVWYTLQLTDIGAIQVAARVVAATARDIARTVPGVRVAFGTSTLHPRAAQVEKATLGHYPPAAVGVLGRTAVLDLALAVDYGSDIDAVARDVQHRVINDLRAIIGLNNVTVNVTVDDLTV